MNGAEKYIKEVLADKKQEKYCEFVRLAVLRHVKDLEEGHKRGLVFDKKEAQRWIDFSSYFYHWKNKKFAGKKIELEPHQQFYFWTLFGWKRKDGTRRFRTTYKEVARKNGKTTEIAIRANGHLFLDGEHGAQCWFAATKREQALIGLNDAAKIAQASPFISPFYEFTALKDKIQRIVKPEDNSFMAAIGRDTKTEDGHDPSYGIIDEMHEHPTLGAVDILESGMAARSQPMIDIITTAGFNKQGPCYSIVRKTVIDILRGVKEDDSYMGIIYTLDEDDDWKNPKNWIKSNPNLGISVGEDYLKDRIQKAENEGGETEVNVKTKNFNIWVDAAKVWLRDEVWMRGAEPVQKEYKRWFGGLDLASVEDFCSYVLFSEPDSDGIHDVMAFYWIPEEKMRERQRRDRNNYRGWVNEGYLFTTPGNAADYSYIQNFIIELHKNMNITGSAYDKWNAQMLVNNLTDSGCTFASYGQGMAAQSEPTKMLQKLALNGQIRHGGHPILRWNINNVVVRSDANGNIIMDKAKSSEKIDGARALVNAIAMYQAQKYQEVNNTDAGFFLI